MVDDYASCLDTAGTGTRISALLIGASFVLSTVGAESALGSAEGRRTEEFWRTSAHGMSVYLSAYAVRATGIRIAWSRFRWN